MIDFSNVKPNLLNWVTIGLMAVTFISFFKYVFAVMNVPGFSELFASL